MGKAIEVKIPANAKVTAYSRLKCWRVKIARLTGWEILWAVLNASGLDIGFIHNHDVKVYKNYVEIAYGQGLCLVCAAA